MVLEGLLTDLGLTAAAAGTVAGLIRFVVAFVVLSVVARTVVVPLVERAFDARELDAHARRPLLKLAWGIALFGVVAIAVAVAGFGDLLLSLATVAAAATIAIGFALQSLLSNFVAGVFLFTERTFRIGDWIEWDGNSGVVEDISLRITRVRTFDNELLTVPNSELANGVVKNPVANDTLRQRFVFGIGYDDDIRQATDIIVEEAEAHEEILDDPEPTVRLTELGDSDVGLESRFWIADPSRADVVRIRGEYVTAVKRRFDVEGIDIPYPYRTLDGELTVENVGDTDRPDRVGPAE